MLILEPAPPPMVSAAMAANLSMAVHTSLLMLPETFTREQLYTVIAALSYQGKNYIIICMYISCTNLDVIYYKESYYM